MQNFPEIMGILNVTPDSFSDGGKFLDKNHAIEHCLEMIEDGADIIDIGGESSRPGAKEVSLVEEIDRVIPIINEIRKQNKEIKISIDTTKYEVAKLAIECGANIINDISGLNNDERLAELSSRYNCPLIIMHIQGNPRTMQKNPFYNNVVQEVYDIIKDKINLARSFGVKEIIADVGVGFGKTFEHNVELLKNIAKFKELDVPLLLGISRKSFIVDITDISEPAERDIATAFIHSILLNENIEIIRVHNVKLISLLKKIYFYLKK